MEVLRIMLSALLPPRVCRHRRRRPGVVSASVSFLVVALSVTLSSVVDAAGIPGIPTGMGPYRLELRGTASCAAAEKCHHPEKLSVANVSLTQDPQDDLKFVNGMDVNVSVAMDERFKAEFTVSSWNAATDAFSSKSLFRMVVPDPCAAAKAQYPDVFQRLLAAVYNGTVTDCPLPPVSAQLRGFVVPVKIPGNLKRLPYGRYKSRVKLFDATKECVYCYDVVSDVLPKRRDR